MLNKLYQFTRFLFMHQWNKVEVDNIKMFSSPLILINVTVEWQWTLKSTAQQKCQTFPPTDIHSQRAVENPSEKFSQLLHIIIWHNFSKWYSMSFTRTQPIFKASLITTCYCRLFAVFYILLASVYFNHALTQNSIHYKQNFTHPSVCRSNITSFMKTSPTPNGEPFSKSFPKLKLRATFRSRHNVQGPVYKWNIYLFMYLFARSWGRSEPPVCGH